jgi:hypothetical protein
MFKVLKSEENSQILEKLASQSYVENALEDTGITKSGSFVVDYKTFFKENKSSNNFCFRNKVIIEFPRKCKSPCKILISYQYRQSSIEDHPHIKIVGQCQNGLCHHEYVIQKREEQKCCKVSFKIFGIFLNNDISTPLHEMVACTPLKGTYREEVAMEARQTGPLRTYLNQLEKANECEIDSLNYTSVISPSVIRKLSSQPTGTYSLEKIKEAVEERKEHEWDPLKKFPGLIRNVTHDRFAVYSYTEEQLSIFANIVNNSSWWTNPIQLACDTSGDIFPPARTMKGKEKFFNFAITLSSTNMKTLPLGEMLTLKVDAKNVNLFMTNFVCDLEKLSNQKCLKLPQIFCTDYTWVNIHPILHVFFKTDIHKYLENKFQLFPEYEGSEQSLLLIDKLHLIKFLLMNCRKIATNNFVAETFVAVFLHLLRCRSQLHLEKHWVSVINVFGCSKRKEDHFYIIEQFSELDEIFCSDKSVEKDDVHGNDEMEPDYICKKPIKKSSKFYSYFKSFMDAESAECSETGEIEDNIFYCPKLLEFVVENYLPLFPLMSLYFIPSRDIIDLPTTSDVENYWKNVKQFFSTIPFKRRDVKLYFTMMQSFFNSQTKEYMLMKKSRALNYKLTNKEKVRDPDLFYPNLGKRTKHLDSAGNFDQEDGYTKRNVKAKKPSKYVRRKVDLHNIEQSAKNIEIKGKRKRKCSDTTIGAEKESQSVVKDKKQRKICMVDRLLNLPIKEFEESEVKTRKRRPCILCRSLEHTRRSCPKAEMLLAK